MNKIKKIIEQIPTPCYVLEEELLERNLKLLDFVQEQTGAKILLALKGFAFIASFDLVSKYLHGCCASGLYEARLASEEFGGEIHTYSPAFKDEEFEEILRYSNHIIFNSFNQLLLFGRRVKQEGSIGLRVNPEVSVAPVELYNPCGLFSRFGVTMAEFEELPPCVEGFHFHALCEESAESLELVLNAFEEKFAKYIYGLKWVNFGGGHHITKEGYDVDKLINLITAFGQKYDVEVYLELGEAVGWQTGVLVTEVLDIVKNEMDILVVDTSAEAHMPDTIAMPYRADIRGSGKIGEKKYGYRIAGNSCLAGDIVGDYSFGQKIVIGDKIIIEDQIHYSIVKNTTFNGIKLPSLGILRKNGDFEVVKSFDYLSYKSRN